MFVWKYLRKHWVSAFVATLSSFAQGAAAAVISTMAGPALQMLMMPDRSRVMPWRELLGPRLGQWIEAGSGVEGITAAEMFARLPVFLIALAFVKAFFSLTQWFLWERAGEKISRAVREELMGLYVRFDPARRRMDHARDRESTLSSTIATDVRMMREYIVHFYGGIPRESLQLLFLGVTLALLNFRLFVVFVLGVVPCVAFATMLGKKIRRRAHAALKNFGELTEWLQQRLLGIETIKHYRTETLESARFERATGDLFHRFLKAARVKARTQPMIEAIGIASMAMALAFAFAEIAAGRTTPAVTISFFGTLGMASQAATKLGRYLNSNREGAAAVERLVAMRAFLSEGARPRVGLQPKIASTPISRLRCEGVGVCYPGQREEALRDFSYTFEGGKIYCLCGPSGSGKSTLFNLVLGLVDTTRGAVELEIPEARALPVCYVPQKILLASDTIAANVAYPELAPDRARVARAIDAVGLSEVVGECPQGIETLVGEGGKGLSGGQAQRVMLARAHYHAGAFVLLMDEGTSALDPETEQLALDSLRAKAREGAVVIMIAHRPAGAAMSDEVLVLDRGQLVAAGATETVMTTEAFHRVFV